MRKSLKITIAIIVIIIVGVVAYFCTRDKNSEDKYYEIEKVNDYAFFILKENNKYGVMNKEGNVVISPTYDEVKIPNPDKDIFICYTENTSKVLNSKSEEMFTEYKQVEPIRLKNVISNLMYEKSTLTYVENNKMGLIDFNGKKIINAKYESIESLPSQEGKFLIKQDGKVGILNIKGYELIKCQYDKIDIDDYYHDNSYQYAGYIVSNTTKEGYRYGYINYKGEEVLKPEYNELSRITEIDDKDNEYLITAKNGQYGVYKNKDKVINNEYQSIWFEPKNEVFVVEKSKKYGVMNEKGKTIIPIEYDQIDITGICISATKDGEVKKYDKDGKELQIPENESILNTDNEKYRIEIINGESVLYGVEDNTGKEIIPKEYTYIEYLSDNYFIASNKDGKLGIIDDKNNHILELKYTTLQKVEETDILRAGDTNTGITELYSNKLKKICEASSPTIKQKGDYIYLINEEGTKYINVNTQKEEKNTEVFKDNELFASKQKNLWGFVNRNGETKVDYQYEQVTEFNKYGYAGVKKNGKWGIINTNGEIVLEPTYTISKDNESNVEFIGKYHSVEYGFGEVYYTNESDVIE